MKPRKRTEFSFGREGAAAMFVLVLLAGMFAYFTGVTFGEQTTTKAQTTVFRTANFTSYSVQTYTQDYYYTVTFTAFSIATYIGPDKVELSGTAHSSGAGTTADQIEFIPSGGGQQVTSPVSSGQYQVVLQNHASYIVQISFSTPIGLGSGTCTAGGLVMYATFNSTTADWGC